MTSNKDKKCRLCKNLFVFDKILSKFRRMPETVFHRMSVLGILFLTPTKRTIIFYTPIGELMSRNEIETALCWLKTCTTSHSGMYTSFFVRTHMSSRPHKQLKNVLAVIHFTDYFIIEKY